MSIERTLVLVKPDGVRRGLIGEVIGRFERKGLNIVALKMLRLSREQAGQHYAVHQGKPFFGSLVDFITSGALVAMVLEGPQAIELTRRMMGATRPSEAAPGTIRGDFANDVQHNIVHGSDSLESAQHEIPIYFADEEIVADHEFWSCLEVLTD